MAQPIAIHDERFPELAQPMSVAAHTFLARALHGASGEQVDGRVVLDVSPGDGQAYHGSFSEQLEGCFKNRGWDCEITQQGDLTAKVTLTTSGDKLKAAKLGARFPGSDKLAVGGVNLGPARVGESLQR